mmetsp:Transcript_44543/g.73983  ORF Transcript_44543/g.73983 Transcript_44543/m.73983 type:complete len:98 (-) Transcript_44543:208-501(-)
MKKVSEMESQIENTSQQNAGECAACAETAAASHALHAEMEVLRREARAVEEGAAKQPPPDPAAEERLAALEQENSSLKNQVMVCKNLIATLKGAAKK